MESSHDIHSDSSIGGHNKIILKVVFAMSIVSTRKNCAREESCTHLAIHTIDGDVCTCNNYAPIEVRPHLPPSGHRRGHGRGFDHLAVNDPACGVKSSFKYCQIPV